MLNCLNAYKLSSAVLGLLVSCAGLLDACTGMNLVAKDGSIIQGRTLEFGVLLDPSIVVVPRGIEYQGTTPQGPGLKYRTKYGAVGAIVFDNPAMLDGLNEKGLSVGTFYFPGFAEYTTVTSQNQSMALSPIDFPNWVLTQFATIDEVKENLSKVIIAPTIIKEWGPSPAPFHFIVADKTGKSLVIEPRGGKLVASDNPLGVLTNSPTFDWHMENLRNYVNLTNLNAKPLQVAGLNLAPFGQGSGLLGLPGDFTPPSRFIRAAIFSLTATLPENADKAVGQLFHILNQFDIPVGAVSAKEGGVVYSDYTQITCVRDAQSLTYYFKTYDDQAIRFIELKSFDLNAKAIKKMNTAGSRSFTNVTANLK